MRALSLEAIGARTKIPERHLRALEEGRFVDLPGGIFRRGILRGYLDALGMGSEPWMERYEACLAELPVGDGAEDLAVFAEGVRRSRPVVDRRVEALRWPGVLVIVGALLLFGWWVWRYALRDRLVLSTGERDGVVLRDENSGRS